MSHHSLQDISGQDKAGLSMASTRLFFARSRSSLAGSVVRPALPLAARSLHHLPPLQRPSLTSSSSSKGASPSPAEPEALPPRRSLLYVPGSSDKMIKGVQASRADCLIFDLEDSVAPHRKGTARESVRYGLEVSWWRGVWYHAHTERERERGV